MSQKEPLDIVLYPHPFLSKRGRKVTDEEIKSGKLTLSEKERVAGLPAEWDLKDLAERMVATMYANEGIGLAAPQVGLGVRIFVADITKEKSGPFAILNPVLSQTKGSVVEEEGCLSIPGVRAKVKRHAELKLTGVNIQGEPIEADVTELASRVCQHENDHLDGVLFINKIGMTAKLMIRKRLMELEDEFNAEQKKKKK